MAKPRPRSYFVQAPAATADEVEDTLWNREVTAASFSDAQERYQAALLEQYKLYVEMADRVSARRALANTFFLTLNTAILTTIGLLLKAHPNGARWALVFPLLILLVECLAWFWIVRSYRQLNSGKWAVVGALEKRLPASPWWRAEWEALGRGENPARYWPLTHVEQLVPLCFALTYLLGFIVVVAL